MHAAQLIGSELVWMDLAEPKHDAISQELAIFGVLVDEFENLTQDRFPSLAMPRTVSICGESTGMSLLRLPLMASVLPGCRVSRR